ncbi:MAG TPA: sulfite exporter TauE/SafE family protein [Candidatus Cloacimonas sp.]|nr:sulfite exporter TauE/SafE family protein [Candidatus Cloacimonas sp.]
MKIGLIFLLAAMLQGLTGFGFSILAVPLLTLFFSPKLMVPVLLLYSILINVVVFSSCWRSLELKRILVLLIFGIIGMPLGTHLLVVLPDNYLRIGIGFLIFVFGCLQLLGFKKKFKQNSMVSAPIGLISGILSGSISMSGPPIILLLTNQEVDKNVFRSNLAAYFFILNIFTIPVYIMNNLLTTPVLNISLKYLPALLMGVLAGNYFSHKIKEEHFRKITLLLLILLGIISIFGGIGIL